MTCGGTGGVSGINLSRFFHTLDVINPVRKATAAAPRTIQIQRGMRPGSFLTAGATVRYLLSTGAREISLVAMGWNARDEALEDVLCAEYLEARLRGENPDFSAMRSLIRKDATGMRFFDSALPWFPEADFDACIELDRFDSAIVAIPDETFGIRLEAVCATDSV